MELNKKKNAIKNHLQIAKNILENFDDLIYIN